MRCMWIGQKHFNQIPVCTLHEQACQSWPAVSWQSIIGNNSLNRTIPCQHRSPPSENNSSDRLTLPNTVCLQPHLGKVHSTSQTDAWTQRLIYVRQSSSFNRTVAKIQHQKHRAVINFPPTSSRWLTIPSRGPKTYGGHQFSHAHMSPEDALWCTIYAGDRPTDHLAITTVQLPQGKTLEGVSY
jgi:hypothetical protein